MIYSTISLVTDTRIGNIYLLKYIFHIFLKDIPIQIEMAKKYILTGTYYHGLSWNKHADNLADKETRRKRLLKKVTGDMWGVRKKTYLHHKLETWL